MLIAPGLVLLLRSVKLFCYSFKLGGGVVMGFEESCTRKQGFVLIRR